MSRVYVARHGETEWNRTGRYQGQGDAPLTVLGERQAQALAAALANAGARRIVSSPLGRCLETARPLADVLGVAVETDDRLLEIHHGTWQGRLRLEIERDDAARMQAWRTAPESVTFEGGESLVDVDARWRRFARALAGKDDTVVVTHDVIVRLAILAAQGRPLGDFWLPRVANGGYAVFETGADGWHLTQECHDAHLAGLLADTTRQAL